MKNVLLLAFALILGGSLMAQDSGKKVIVIKKNKDGSITKIEKAVKDGDDTVIYIREAGELGEEAGRLHINSKELEEKLGQLKGADLEKLRELKGELSELREIQFMRGDVQNREDENRRLIPEKAQKAFLGVVAGEAEGDIGFRVNRVVEGSGAEAGGLLRGDVVVSINNNPTNGSHGLTGVLARFKPNDQVKLEVLRNGQPVSLNVTLTETEYTRYVLNDERNPCDVFIGVYTADFATKGEGVRVTSIIGNTPAETYGVQAGDIILSLDGVEVTSGNQLRYERDKHEAGEAFSLLVNRNGDFIDINARFKSCEEAIQEDEVADEPIAPVEQQPALAPVEESNPLVQPRDVPTLDLERWQAFPNPSLGDITIEFQADPVPTTLRVIDASGKVIHQEQMNNFDGLYKKELNLRSATPGTLLLSIQQGEKIVTKQLVLLNRA